jgi:asparagine synthase (glutamine-hydrolysing)
VCGIAGVLRFGHGARVDAQMLAAMGRVLAHRGPNDAAEVVDGPVGFAFRRLAIIDLSPAGAQPMPNEDGSVLVVMNGELYNHAELRPWLEARGHRYRGRSDTETLVHLYEEEGERAVERLRGMFAFAIWDRRRGALLLGRDRLGIKPLYLAWRPDRLVFGSEIKAILEDPTVPRALDVEVLPEFLANRAVGGDRTLFAGVTALEPGTTLSVSADGAARRRRFWEIPPGPEPAGDASNPPATGPSEEARLVEEFAARLDEAVRLRLMSDVPLGMFLSGGIDSSAIAAVMARHVGGRLKTFSVGFGEAGFNELAYARDVAAAVGAEPHETLVGADEFFEELPRLTWHEDGPLAHPSSVPLNAVSRLARSRVTVVLTGEGSDELLAGYGRYRTSLQMAVASRAWRHLPASLRQAVAGALPGAPIPWRLKRQLLRTPLALPTTPEGVFWEPFAPVPLAAQAQLLSPELRPLAHADLAYGLQRRLFDARAGRPLLERLLYVDLKTYLVELLMKQDQMSMAASIESRVPFLDHPLVEFVQRLPQALKLNGRVTKVVLRRAAAARLPRAVLERPKVGFPVPLAGWLRGRHAEWARRLLTDRRARARGLFVPATVERWLDEHASGRRDWSDRLWLLIGLELWHRAFIDAASAAPMAAAGGGRA